MKRFLKENTLSLFFLAIFLLALLGQAISGHNLYNVMENWQSEFLAVGSFAVLVTYLRQRGSPESKPVGASISDATGQVG